MHLKALFIPPQTGFTKTCPARLRAVLLIMKFTTIILFSVCLQASAGGYSQTVSLSGKNISLEKVFKEIKKQTGYDFWYEGKLIRQAKKVDIQAVNSPIEL